MTKKLYRSSSDAKVCGVCGGIGEYMDIDPTIIRIFMVIIIFMSSIAPGLLAYFILALFIPRMPEYPRHSHHHDNHN